MKHVLKSGCTTTTSRDPTKGAERKCVACGTSKTSSELLRLSAMNGALVIEGATSGRGAYVCIARDCLESVRAHELSKTLREKVGSFSNEELIARAHALAKQRVLETVGLARRQGVLQSGAEPIIRGGTAQEGVIIAATDLSRRTRTAAPASAVALVSGDRLGKAAGMGWVGMARIQEGPLARRAAYWLALWYETRSADPALDAASGSRATVQGTTSAR